MLDTSDKLDDNQNHADNSVLALHNMLHVSDHAAIVVYIDDIAKNLHLKKIKFVVVYK